MEKKRVVQANNQVSVAELLPNDPNEAMSREELRKKLGGIDDRTLRNRIQAERDRGALICSPEDGGYFLAENLEVAEPFLRMMEAHISRRLQTVVAMRNGGAVE